MLTVKNNTRRAALPLLAVLAASWLGGAARADVITDWNATTQAVVLATPGAQIPIYLSLVHVAMYDAVIAIDRRYAPFAVQPTVETRGASKEAAAAAAAYRVLASEAPAQQTLLDAAYAASLAALPDGAAKTRGIAVGEEVAALWLAKRADDGRHGSATYTFGSGPGVYQPTPPGNGPPVAPWVANVQPFSLERASQFRAYGPPDVTSERFALDLNLTKALGASSSAERTAEETEIALFHTENPTTFWARNWRSLAADRKLGLVEDARLFAMLSVAFGDGVIACWDSKYYYNFWRPITAIRAADTDDNPATEADAAWTPLAVTPPHPEYPAAHGCVAGGFAEVLRQFFGTKWIRFTFTSSVPNTVPHRYDNVDELIEEIEWARIFGGMHFQTSVEDGVTMGRKVGRWITRSYFRPLHP
jgi:hypothetical protein